MQLLAGELGQGVGRADLLAVDSDTGRVARYDSGFAGGNDRSRMIFSRQLVTGDGAVPAGATVSVGNILGGDRDGVLLSDPKRGYSLHRAELAGGRLASIQGVDLGHLASSPGSPSFFGRFAAFDSEPGSQRDDILAVAADGREIIRFDARHLGGGSTYRSAFSGTPPQLDRLPKRRERHWTVLKCKLSSAPDPMQDEQWFRDLFTVEGAGKSGMYDYLQDVSFGTEELISEIPAGWKTLETEPSVGNLKKRGEMAQLCLEAWGRSNDPEKGLMVIFAQGGGKIASAPDCVSRDTNRIDCFVRGRDDALWHRWWDGSRWGIWASLGGVLSSAPTAASWGANRVDVFARGQDNALWHRFWSGSGWSGWGSLGGDLGSAPDCVSRSTDRIDCFVRGRRDNALWRRSWDGSRWRDWASLGGVLTSAPTAASWGVDRLDVFVRGKNHELWHKHWSGAQWSGWGSLGGDLGSAPDCVSWGADRIDCFARGRHDDALWHRWWDGSRWGTWGRLAGIISSAPSAASWGANRLDVFARGQHGQLWRRAWTGSSWTGWQSLGGAYTIDGGQLDNMVVLHLTVFDHTLVAHEMLHVFGLWHSFDDTLRQRETWSAPGEYYDPYDVMGGAGGDFTFRHPRFYRSGVGLNGYHRKQLGYIPPHRIRSLSPSSPSNEGEHIVKLAALDRPESHGYLLLEFIRPFDHLTAMVEYRQNTGWDRNSEEGVQVR
ncbi:MAG: hypothetical protein MI919_30535, partial [Holophagales bacterium]|nr:hypothetical protein [Holophagales bacterium]